MPWSGIADVVAETLEAWRDEPIDQVESVLAADEEARVAGPGRGGPPYRSGYRGGSVTPGMTLIAKEPGAAPADRGGAAGARWSRPPPTPRRGNSGQVWRLLIALAAHHGHLPGGRAGRPPALHRHHRRHRDAARAGPLRHRQVGGHEGHRVLRRLRSPAVVGPTGRDRVRGQGHPGRGLRPHHRVHRARRRGRRGRAAHLPPAAVLEADHRRVGRFGHAFPHRLRPGPDQSCSRSG